MDNVRVAVLDSISQPAMATHEAVEGVVRQPVGMRLSVLFSRKVTVVRRGLILNTDGCKHFPVVADENRAAREMAEIHKLLKINLKAIDDVTTPDKPRLLLGLLVDKNQGVNWSGLGARADRDVTWSREDKVCFSGAIVATS